MTKEEKKRTQIININHEKAILLQTLKIIRGHYEQLYANISDESNGVEKFMKIKTLQTDTKET